MRCGGLRVFAKGSDGGEQPLGRQRAWIVPTARCLQFTSAPVARPGRRERGAKCAGRRQSDSSTTLPRSQKFSIVDQTSVVCTVLIISPCGQRLVRSLLKELHFATRSHRS